MPEKQIPLYFDCIVVNSPAQEVVAGNITGNRLKVRAFTKYGNRNGSYITDAVAEQLIASATDGATPVIGFFDPEKREWASHTGPTLANGYGYVESFLGWEPFEDSDGVTRDYAVFSVVLFSKYFEETKEVLGQNQSMELDPESITGDWAEFDDNIYYVYKTAKMLGFCIIGSHEPCFSVSAFFSQKDSEYATQKDKIYSLIFDLKNQIEATLNDVKGGESPMNEFEDIQAPIELEETVETTPPEEVVEPTNFEQEVPDSQPEEAESTAEEHSEFEQLNQQFEMLQNSYNELNTNYENAKSRIQSLENDINSLNEKNASLQEIIDTYQAKEAAADLAAKNTLVEKYEKILGEEKIGEIKTQVNDFSYDELEGKLAVIFANEHINAEPSEEKVPVITPEPSQFALLMEKYKRN